MPGTDGRGRARAWFRMCEDLGDDPLLHACALAYLSDDLPTDSVFRIGPLGSMTEDEAREQVFSVSLDHTIWFHRPLRADEWHLFDFGAHNFTGARGLSIGHVFAQDGTHVATVAQEVLMRRRRE